MTKEDFQTSEHILRRIDRLEDAPEIRIDSAAGRLSIPLAKVEYGERGEINLEGGKWKLHFVYEPSSETTVDKNGDGGEWRVVSVANIETPTGNVDLLQLLPAGRKMYLTPLPHKGTRYWRHGEVRHERGVFLWGDISEPLMLAILLHEMGHVIDIDQLEKKGMLGLITKIDDHEYSAEAAVLRRERVASAFALKVMRPFLTPQQRQDMLLYLKNYALKSYYKDAKRGIEAKEATKASMSDYMQREYDSDMAWLETQNQFDDFLEWKQSDDYTEWKARNPNVEEDDEFGAWRKERDTKVKE